MASISTENTNNNLDINTLIRELKRTKETGGEIPILIRNELIAFLGDEIGKGNLDQILFVLESLSEREKETTGNTINPKKLEELVEQFKIEENKKKVIEMMTANPKKTVGNTVSEFIENFKKKQSNKKGTDDDLDKGNPSAQTTQTQEAKFEETVLPDIGKTKEKVIIPPQKTETVVESQKTETEPVEENEFTKFLGDTEKLGEKAKLAREEKEQQIEQVKEEAKLLAEKISQETVKTIEEETEITFQSNDKKNEVIKQTAEIAYAIILEDKTLTNEEFVEKVIELIEPNKELITEKEQIVETVILQVEPIKTIDKWSELHEDQINKIRAEKIEQEIFSLYKDNNEIKKENILEYTKLVKEFVVKTPKIRKELQDKIIEKDLEKLGPYEIEKRKTDIETWARVTAMSPKEFKKFIEQYENARDKLKGNLPLKNKRVISLDNFFRSFRDLSKQQQSFIFQIQRQKIFQDYTFPSEFFIRFQNFFLRQNNNFVGGIRDGRIINFFQNSFGFLKNGFSQNFFSGIKGLFSKTASGFFGFGAKTAMTVGAGISTGGLANLAMGAKKLLDKLGGILKGLGLDLTSGLKKFLNENLGKIGSALGELADSAQKVLTGAFSLFLIIFLAVFGVLFFKQKADADILSTLVSTIESSLTQEIDLNDSISCNNKTGYVNPTKSYQSNTDEKFTLWVFEQGSNGGRLTQKYNLEESAPLFSQQHINSDYNGGTSNDKLDSRVIPAYEAMVRAGIASGKLSYPDMDLKLTSGYRDKAYQQKLWNDALIKYGSPEAARIYVAPPGCSSHETGRAIDINVDGSAGNPDVFAKQRSSSTFQWLYGTNGKDGNAAKFGFYNYENEPWHWEYNPTENPITQNL